jgi:methylated-DNA-[protein]-cysteine S-methyltransferase
MAGAVVSRPAGRGLRAGAARPAAAYAAVMTTPLPGPGARLGIVVADGELAAIDLLPASAASQAPVDRVAAEAVRQLEAYFRDPSAGFDLPLAAAGTDYQRQVWAAISRIPTGRPTSYGAIARAVGGSPRAVGGACRANPLPIVVPCHRVVAVGGRGGYMGETAGASLEAKAWLLAHEARAST